MAKADLTAQRLRELLHYDPETGIFCWKNGKIAGASRPDGYCHVRIDGRLYLSHRLAWLYMTGDWPMAQIDHIDRNRSNCAFYNLRDISSKQNHHNRDVNIGQGRNAALGVRWDASRGKFLARIKHNGTTKNLGRFINIDDAKAAYLRAKMALHDGFIP